MALPKRQTDEGENLLRWFSEEERAECPFCDARAAIGEAENVMICLACSSIWRRGDLLNG